jgi:Ca2+-binding RTX toxin-like protein
MGGVTSARRILLGGKRARPEDRRWGVIVAVAVLGVLALIAGAAVLARSGGTHHIVGTQRADEIDGTPQADHIEGLGGADHISGHGGNDVIDAGAGFDRVNGGGGNDRLLSAPGGAVLKGGKGRDEFNMVNGETVGGEGNDVIRARDGQLDEINCGPGDDKAYVDRAEDGVYDCETVKEPPPGH